MKFRKVLLPALLVFNLFLLSCVYIVLPEGIEKPDAIDGEAAGWTGIVTGVGESENGELHIELTIRNDTGVWSTMRAADNQPAMLIGSDGSTTNCETVYMSTGGHRMAPGFQARGYTVDQEGLPETQLIYVECQGATASPGATLTIDYISFNGEIDYYVEIEEENQEPGVLELNLDEIVSDLSYPVASPIEGVIHSADTEITALSENVVSLKDVQRDATGFVFTWQNYNPSKFALKTHIGIPPVIGEDGVIYGAYETLDIPPVPLTPAGESIEWSTETAVPDNIVGFYILLSVESNKPRTYLNYAIDITDH